jgi:HEAT repeat protein
MRATLWSVLLVSVLVVSGIGHSRALDKALDKAGSGSVSAKVRDEMLRTAIAKLQQGDEAAIRQGLSTLSELGGDAAAEAVVARLRRGLPPQLIEAAIDDLVLLNRPVVSAALLELTQHRRIQIRIKAMQALAALKQKSAQAPLLYALDDPSSEVRGAAVDALAAVGNARALPALLTAADRDVPGAWRAIGTLAGPNDLKAVLGRAHDGDLMAIRPALDVMLTRKDFPLEARVRVVQQLASLGSPSARACIADWIANAAADQPRLKQALADGLARLDREHPAETKDLKLTKTVLGSPTPKALPASRSAAVSASAPQGAQ